MILPKAILTPSGRPQLGHGEIERLLLDKVDLEFEGVGGTEGCTTADRYQGGYAVVTSQRLFWIDAVASPAPGRSCVVPLLSVVSATKRIGYGLNPMNPKVRLELRLYVDLCGKPSEMHNSAAFRHLQLRCRGPPPDVFAGHLEESLAVLRSSRDTPVRQAQAARLASHPVPTALASMDSCSGAQQLPGALSGALLSHMGNLQQQQPQQPPQPPQQQQQHSAQGSVGGSSVAAPYAVDRELLAALLDMGFPRPRVLRALLATGSEQLQAALDWILAAGEDPDQCGPLTGPEPQQLTQQELTALRSRSQQHAGATAAAATAAATAAAAAAHSQLPRPRLPAGPPPEGGGWLQPAAEAVGWGLPQHQRAAAAGAVEASASPRHTADTPPGQLVAAAAGGGGVVGITGIVRREEARGSAASAHLSAALQDLAALMATAADMVALAERLRGVEGGGGSGDDAGGGGGGGLDAETALALAAAGIASPVTRASAGSRYTLELARQLSDFLAPALAARGGLLLLPDVYCAFNRARGTELVSPDDLVAACEAFPAAGLPLRLRRFASGVLAVQGPQFSDDALCSALADLLQRNATADKPEQDQSVAAGGLAPPPPLGAPLSAAAVAAALGLPLTLAHEALLVGESRGVLCRDDGPQGLRFFRNFFADGAVAAASAALLTAPA